MEQQKLHEGLKALEETFGKDYCKDLKLSVKLEVCLPKNFCSCFCI